MTTSEILSGLFEKQFKQQPESIKQLPQSGSERIYYRLQNSQYCVIGAFNANEGENEAFFSFTETFRKLQFSVPEILVIAPDRKHYLLSDLGDETLSDYLKRSEKGNKLELFQKILDLLLKIQLEGGKHIDFGKCYPRAAFDWQSIFWDLNYFKYEFLKLAAIPFDEQALEDDFHRLANKLLEAGQSFFMYRDFQSRNIMMKDDEPCFIDYQGGRKGPLHYDVASLLYSPKSALDEGEREQLLLFYAKSACQLSNVDLQTFKKQFYVFALIRILQALGAYGFRGLYERKPGFSESIATAIGNLNSLFNENKIAVELPEIKKIAARLQASKWADQYQADPDQLTLRITSFSYKKGIPDDPSGNGGGFVFDCRGLPNPGRLEAYRSLSGLDSEVINYLEQYPQVATFQKQLRKILEISINEYLTRGFKHLCVNFGCTGGQHRSVYQAEKFAAWVKNNYPVKVVLLHNEEKHWSKK
ncbi:RapZ C-terminal domain-containing protein [Roseimarinus sediminis]|uniref:RapZ C-terminal domain-containing protein n=1 Tax=Roseimarinus sediminis TaxID=1610899 RepID=UPI003D2625CD